MAAQANALLARLGFEHPIIQAPLGGIPTTTLVAEVSEAGALGSLGAAYLSPEQLEDAIGEIRSRTSTPFAVNLFAGGWDASAGGDARRMLELLAGVHERLGLPPPTVPTLAADAFEAQLAVVLDARPAAFSFTFGVPSAEVLGRLRERDVFTMGTATTVEEARLLERAGVDAVVAQGAEAGGHRGTFAGPFEAALVPTARLVAESVSAVRVPVIASGGLMDGRDVAAMLRLGAAAAQLGTAFLVTPECGASAAYKRAILAARADTTALTRAFSGRPARGLENAFMRLVDAEPGAILPYPLQNALTRPMRAAAAQQGDPEHLSLWAGQGVARARALPARELVRRLVEELGG
ncbi:MULTISPECIES: nitronate monooxygenase family protein [Anaeromyxobacter]|uniref:NAD(P)H-dependent flavin oxidoreductase n=1 Tax=Anaeromyxobacter TaxID=161492 RepID=UPI001F59A69D|nr:MULTISPECIES: nitronate monooxygenase [unclassified Anaeromyxobacter]